MKKIVFLHTHSWICTFEICGVGPRREQLIVGTLGRKFMRGDEFWHYKRSEVEALMLRSGLPAVPVMKDGGEHGPHLTKANSRNVHAAPAEAGNADA